ncbi:MAG: DNA primase [Defluviitaleaceae bacterium]|nr:DNA primase [Defluviitaleaceae bacterium]
MYYPPEIVSEVRALNDVVDVVAGYVKLTPRANNHFGLCPFHSEKTASFSVNRDKQIFYCFGCGASGDVVRFVMQMENMDFPEALKLLASRVHFKLPEKGTSHEARNNANLRKSAAELNKRAARYYYDYLNSENSDAQNARKYLEERGVTQVLIKRFGIGLSPAIWDGLLTHLSDAPPEEIVAAGLAVQSRKSETRFYDRFRSRLTFPIIDQQNRVVGFGGRILDVSDKGSNAGDKQEAKYINTPETALFRKSEHLYGLNLARKARGSELIVVEGYMDVIAMHQHGFNNTVGVLGTALNDSHVRQLRGASCASVILLMDSDDAGNRAALRAIPVLTKGGIKVKILEIPDAKDPDEFLTRFGAKRFAGLLQAAKSHIAFQVDLVRGRHDLSTTDGRVGFTQEAAKILATLPSAIETDAYAAQVAAASGISPAAIHAEINKHTSGGNSAQMLTTPHNMQPRSQRADYGLIKAQKGLLHLVLTAPSAARALKKSGFLPTGEMSGDIYARLLALAYENAENSAKLSPGDIMDMLENPDEQQAVGEIFIDAPEYPDTSAMEKALNDMVKKIKLAWLDNQIEIQKTDLKAVNKLHFEKKNTLLLNITMRDG